LRPRAGLSAPLVAPSLMK